MSLYAVTYTYVTDEARLAEIRPEHRAFLGSLADEGIVLLSGPTAGDGPGDALILLRAGSAEDARSALIARVPQKTDGSSTGHKRKRRRKPAKPKKAAESAGE